MATDPLTGRPQVGQGVPGGGANLPNFPGSAPPAGTIPTPAGVGGGDPLGGGGAAGPSISTGLTGSGATVPSFGRVPALTTSSLAKNAMPTLKAHDLATAVSILDQVAAGQLTSAEVKSVLSKGFSSKEHDFLVAYATRKFGARAVEPLRALGAKSKSSDDGGSFLGNLAGDIKDTITGTPATLALAGKAVGVDVKDFATNPLSTHPKSQLLQNVVKPGVQGVWHDVGPLIKGTAEAATGDVGGAVKEYSTFAHRFHAHPLGPITDAMAVVSGGASLAGRSAAAMRAIKATEVTRTSTGLAQVGAAAGLNMKVEPMANGMWRIRDRGKIYRSNFPTEDAAIGHAQSVASGGVNPIVLKENLAAARAGEVGAKAPAAFGAKAARARPVNPFMAVYNRAKRESIEAEDMRIQNELMHTLGDPLLRTTRRSPGEVMSEIGADISATRSARKKAAARSPVITPVMAGLTEITDAVRAGSIYLRPAYLPNNWAGNSLMSVIDQGVYAPLNLGKAIFFMNKMDKRNLAAMRDAMGMNATQMISPGKGHGYFASVTAPVATWMSRLADTPFRDAAMLHALRRKGYNSLDRVNQLFNEARLNTPEGEAAAQEISKAANLAQEDIVKFNPYSDEERGVVRNLVFIYAWMRGAGRYAVRFPMAHPIQASLAANTQETGNKWLKDEMGGVPSFLVGAIPVGRDSKGNPILINPFNLNPLGTGLDIGKAVVNTARAAKGDPSFDRYADPTVIDLLNPVYKSVVSSIYEKRPATTQMLQTVGLYNLTKGLVHPGSGSIYPTTRGEAVGKFTFGSLYPRTADQMAIERSLTREHIGNPGALIPTQLKTFKKITGEDIPQEIVTAYKADLDQLKDMHTYQHQYATHHGSSGFRNLPAKNRAEAAVGYVEDRGFLKPDELDKVKTAMDSFTTDEEYNTLATMLWSSTGIGEVSRKWQELIRNANRQRLSRARQ